MYKPEHTPPEQILGLAPVAWGFLILFGFLFTLMLTGFFPYHIYLTVNNRTTIENMERNSRLLGDFIPRKAEGVLSAGTFNLGEAGLPERPKRMGGRNLRRDRPPHPLDTEPLTMAPQPIPSGAFHPQVNPPHNASNPFLPAQAYSVPATSSYPQNAPGHPAPSALQSLKVQNAAASLSRLAIRQLEKKAGKINIYDLGFSAQNFKQAFDSDWNHLASWVPVGGSLGNGYEFPVNKRKLVKLQRLNEQLRAGARAGV